MLLRDDGDCDMTSRGVVSLLLQALKVLRTSGGSLVLANVSEPVEAVLRITRLSRVFEITSDVNEALSMARAASNSTGRPG